MPVRIIDTIQSPADLKKLSNLELRQLADEIRETLIATTSETGGHLAPSLGAVELILGIHCVIDAPHDKLVFDVGHQAYAHKLITGRRDAFDTLRTYGGLSGFTKRLESEYDVHDSGHASDSISTALGLALARDLRGGDETIIAFIGDGSIGGGLALEALNQIGQLHTKITIVLNDNEMSIAKNVGALSLHLARARTAAPYRKARNRLTKHLESPNPVVRWFFRAGLAVRDSLKQLVVPGMLFEEMGIKYMGPIDGHDIEDVKTAVLTAQKATGPVIIHALTHKGEGYAPAEDNPEVFHGIGPFDPLTGVAYKKDVKAPSYTKAFSDALLDEASKDEDIVAITAAMPGGTGLDAFGKRFPERFIDVGIAEEHATALANGLALGGKLPVVAIYSTFLQRAFDEIITNVALQKLHVVFAIDRAGIVGADGATHHGLFDIAYMRMIPNMKVLAPSDEAELVCALHTALALDGPVAIRYPRGNGTGADIPKPPAILPLGKAVVRTSGDDVCILALGHMVGLALAVADVLAADGISAKVYDMRWAKPIDVDAVRDASHYPLLVTMEEGVVAGGFGEGVLDVLQSQESQPKTLLFGIPDTFVPQGDLLQLLADLGLSRKAVAARIKAALAQRQEDDV